MRTDITYIRHEIMTYTFTRSKVNIFILLSKHLIINYI